MRSTSKKSHLRVPFNRGEKDIRGSCVHILRWETWGNLWMLRRQGGEQTKHKKCNPQRVGSQVLKGYNAGINSYNARLPQTATMQATLLSTSLFICFVCFVLQTAWNMGQWWPRDVQCRDYHQHPAGKIRQYGKNRLLQRPGTSPFYMQPLWYWLVLQSLCHPLWLLHSVMTSWQRAEILWIPVRTILLTLVQVSRTPLHITGHKRTRTCYCNIHLVNPALSFSYGAENHIKYDHILLWELAGALTSGSTKSL